MLQQQCLLRRGDGGGVSSSRALSQGSMLRRAMLYAAADAKDAGNPNWKKMPFADAILQNPGDRWDELDSSASSEFGDPTLREGLCDSDRSSSQNYNISLPLAIPLACEDSHN